MNNMETSPLGLFLLAIEPSQFDAAMAGLRRFVDSANFEQFDLQKAYVPDSRAETFSVDFGRPYDVRSGTLIVPVKGFLMDVGFSFGSFLTGYGYVRDAMARAASDPDVEQIALDVDSPGGAVAGMFEMAEFISSYHAKPVTAFVRHTAASAAYATISGADRIVLSRRGAAGSIGAIIEHMSVRRALEAAGIDYTVIAAGDRKADGHLALDLAPEAEEKYREIVNSAFEEFTALVSENRGIQVEEVRGMQSDIYIGDKAREMGLVDEVADVSKALMDYIGAKTMTEKNLTPAEEMFTQNDLDKACAEAREAGVKAERERIAGIMGLEEANGREQFAMKLCLTTDLDADAAKALLEAVPAEAETAAPASTSRNHFEEAMNASGEPVPAAAPKEEIASETDDPLAKASELVASYKAAVAY